MAVKKSRIPSIPRDYNQLVRDFEPTIQAKMNSMRVWPQVRQDVYHEIIMVFMHRKLIERYHTRYAERILEPTTPQEQVLQILQDQGTVTTHCLSSQLRLSLEDLNPILLSLQEADNIKQELAPFNQHKLDLNDKEQAIFDCFCEEPQWTLTDLTNRCFPSGAGTDHTSWTRNSLRRLVRNQAVMKSGRGTYERINPVGWSWVPKADNPLRFKRYLTLAVSNYLMDYMKRAKRDAQTHQLMYYPEGEAESMKFEQFLDCVSQQGPDQTMVEFWDATSQLNDTDQSVLNEMLDPIYVEIPEEAQNFPLGKTVRIEYGDDLVAGTIVLRRREGTDGPVDRCSERALLLQPTRKQVVDTLGIDLTKLGKIRHNLQEMASA